MLSVTQLSGFGAGGDAAPAWDPLNKSSSFTLTAGNATATHSGGSTDSVLSVAGFSSGKRYAEMRMNALGFQVFVGFATTRSADGQRPGVDNSTGWSYRNNSDLYYNTGTYAGAAATGSYTTNDVIMLAYDAATGKMWFGKNNTWIGDPGAGTGNSMSTTAGTTLYISLATPDSGSATLFTDSFNYALPSGFSAWKTP